MLATFLLLTVKRIYLVYKDHDIYIVIRMVHWCTINKTYFSLVTNGLLTTPAGT